MFTLFKKKKEEPKNWDEVIQFLAKLEGDIEGLRALVQKMQEKDKKHVQKIGVVRFNPFQDVGGDQSFCVALLDEENNGVLITSLYGRGGNRVYAKAIEGGKSKYQLSEEEKEAIEKAGFQQLHSSNRK